MKNFEIILDALGDTIKSKDIEINFLRMKFEELSKENAQLKEKNPSTVAAVSGETINNPTTLYTKLGLESIARAVE